MCNSVGFIWLVLMVTLNGEAGWLEVHFAEESFIHRAAE